MTTPANTLAQALANEERQSREAAFNARRVRENRAAKLASEPKRHRRPVKSTVITANEIDFAGL